MVESGKEEIRRRENLVYDRESWELRRERCKGMKARGERKKGEIDSSLDDGRMTVLVWAQWRGNSVSGMRGGRYKRSYVGEG